MIRTGGGQGYVQHPDGTWQRVRRVHVPVTPPAQPHCSACLKTLAWLQACAHLYECSRVDCAQRRAVTAAPRITTTSTDE